MAPKGTKRGAPAQASTPEKKVKHDPLLVGVIDAIGQAEGLTEACRAMLVAGAPGCMSTPADERHELQATMASWIGQVLDSVRAKLQEAVDAAEAEAAKVEGSKGELDSKVAETQAALSAKDEAVAAKGAALAEATTAEATAKEALAEAQKAQSEGDASLVEVEKEKEELEAALSQHLEFLKQEAGFDAGPAKEHMEALLPLAKRLALDESLLTAMPAACTKPPGQRGRFDHMVVEQLEANLSSKIAALKGTLDAGAPAKAGRAEATAAAQKSVESAAEAQSVAGTELAHAEAEQKEAASALAAAEAAVVAFKPTLDVAVAAKDKKEWALQNFIGYNLECFNMLRDKSSAAKEAAPAEA